MRSFLFTLPLTVSLFFSGTLTYAACDDVLNDFRASQGAPRSLSPELFQALQAAKNDTNLTVSIVSKNEGGKESSIIFLGERHVKTKETSDVAKNVLDHIQYNGVEGYDISKLWGFSALKYLLRSIIDKTARAEDAKGETEGSTVNDAYRISATTDPTFIQILINEGVANLSAEELKTKTYAFDQDNQVTFTGEEALQIVKNAKAYGGKPPAKLEVISIESERKPTLGENLASIYLPALALSYGSVMVAQFLPSGGVEHGINLVTTSLAGGLSAYLLAEQLFLKYFPSRTPLFLFASPRMGLLRTRNKDMAQNLDSIAQRPEVNQILATVGSAHVPGVIRLLREKGYHETSLADIAPK